MQQQQPSRHDRPVVLVLDAMALRRAKLASFLREWAVENHVSIIAAAPAELTALLGAGTRIGMALLSLGGMSLTLPPQDGWLRELLDTAPRIPLVIVSDRDEVEEVVAAVRAGASGYLPTSTEPEMALKALSFILNGGSFFPPSALLERQEAPPSRRLPIRLKPPSEGRGPRCLPSLTLRQMAVLTHLQAGMPNKVIGVLLGVSESTVKDHVRHIMRRLGALNRTQAALAAGTETALDSAGPDDTGATIWPLRRPGGRPAG